MAPKDAEPITDDTMSPAAEAAGSNSAKEPRVPMRANRKWRWIAVGVLVAVLVAGGAWALFWRNRITRQDVTAAQHALAVLQADSPAEQTAYAKALKASTAADAKAALAAARSKLDDAQTQYQRLANSPVRHDAATQQKLAALAKPWNAYAGLLGQELDDADTLLPIVTQQVAAMQALTNSDAQNNFTVYLAKYKSIIDTTSSQLKNVRMRLSEDQDVVTAMRAYLSTASKDIGQAQQDAQPGGDSSAVIGDLFHVGDAAETSAGLNATSRDQLKAKAAQLYPAAQLSDLQKTLGALAQRVK